eukprot:5592414-Prymnesium_polylepis.1
MELLAMLGASIKESFKPARARSTLRRAPAASTPLGPSPCAPAASTALAVLQTGSTHTHPEPLPRPLPSTLTLHPYRLLRPRPSPCAPAAPSPASSALAPSLLSDGRCRPPAPPSD